MPITQPGALWSHLCNWGMGVQRHAEAVCQGPERDKLRRVSGGKEVLEKHCWRKNICCCRLRPLMMFLSNSFKKVEKNLTSHPLCLKTLGWNSLTICFEIYFCIVWNQRDATFCHELFSSRLMPPQHYPRHNLEHKQRFCLQIWPFALWSADECPKSDHHSPTSTNPSAKVISNSALNSVPYCLGCQQNGKWSQTESSRNANEKPSLLIKGSTQTCPTAQGKKQHVGVLGKTTVPKPENRSHIRAWGEDNHLPPSYIFISKYTSNQQLKNNKDWGKANGSAVISVWGLTT